MRDELTGKGFGTRAIHAGEAPDPFAGAVGVPIYQNTAFAFRSTAQIDAFTRGDVPHYVYSRDGNPTLCCLELKLADLEGTESVILGGSGMAAISTAVLHYVAGGGELLVSDAIYSIAKEFFRESLSDYGAKATFVDATDFDAVRAAITPNTRAIYVEAFSNPLLTVMDIELLATIAHEAGIGLIVDNTFLTPAIMRPLELGADVVVHSATKYLSGHGHLLGGVIAGSRDHLAGMRRRMTQLGGVMSPQVAWLLINGIKTLALRMRQHCANGLAVAEALAEHAAVEAVNYPGLPSHADHELANRLTDGRYSGMLSLRLIDHDRTRGAFLDALTIPIKAVSLGDTTSLAFPFDGDGVIRMSMGIEDTEDLVADVRQALDAVSRALESPGNPVAGSSTIPWTDPWTAAPSSDLRRDTSIRADPVSPGIA